MLEELPMDMQVIAKVPAASHLFMTNENCTALPEDKAQLFHHPIAKLLYLCRCTGQDIQTAVAFLCTRVKGLIQITTKSL